MNKLKFAFFILILGNIWPLENIAETNNIIISPAVEVESVNSEIIGLYEKFEILVNLKDVQYSNPFNPDEMDLRGVFVAPSGKQWEIFGFYDNYLGRNEWKVRFAPNEVGEWTYSLKLTYSMGTVESSIHTFDAVESEYHGWMRVSQKNPHYFEYADGKSFYPVGPYYPWGVRNNSNGLGLMQESGANFFGYWNIMYGSESGIIESLNSGLGRYDQSKCGRIDQLIEWAEERDMKMMLAIWPHDLLCETLGGWAKQWSENPYKTITSAVEFYENELAWLYQEKQYRYLIARWGYSRGLGVWEIVNEITGTDGWAMGKEAEATNWVHKVSEFLKTNDPFGRPTTASQHGGYYWPEGYAQVDVSNVHVYETSWNAEYPGNPLRSSHYLYHTLSNNFWNDFDKPGIFGEAGYTNTYGNFATPSAGYTAHYHNALWASWASGLAATPVWWDMGSRQVMSDDVMAQMKAFSLVAPKIDYTAHRFSPNEITINNCDVYSMVGDSIAFGWICETTSGILGSKQFEITGLPDTSYAARWFDTWTGEELETTIGLSINNSLTLTTLGNSQNPDYAFIITPLMGGGEPASLELSINKSNLLNDGNSTAEVTCIVKDSEGLISTEYPTDISFAVIGSGSIQDNQVTTENGYVKVDFLSGRELGTTYIVVSSEGLKPDTLSVTMSDQILIDNFDYYPNNSILETVWRPQSGTSAQLSLVSSNDKLLSVNYAIGDGNPPYAGFYRYLSENYSEGNYFRFNITPDGSGRDLIIILRANSDYWQYTYKLIGSSPVIEEVPVNEFTPQNTTDEIDLANLTQISFSILPGEGGNGSGVLYFNDMAFSISKITGISDTENINYPEDFKIYHNYPNPFNPATTITYSIGYEAHVNIEVFDMLGQKVATMTDGYRKAGQYKLVFNAAYANRELTSGTYYVRFHIGSGFKTIKITYLK